MTDIKYDWADGKVHPAVRYPSTRASATEDAGIGTAIGMVDSFSPRVVTPKTPIHSLSDHNQGFLSGPPEYYVDVTTKPFGDGYDILRRCQAGDRYFDIVLLPISSYVIKGESTSESLGQPSGAWSPRTVVFEGCKVTDETEKYATATVPTVTFTCRALRYVFDKNKFGDGYSERNMSDILLNLDL